MHKQLGEADGFAAEPAQLEPHALGLVLSEVFPGDQDVTVLASDSFRAA